MPLPLHMLSGQISAPPDTRQEGGFPDFSWLEAVVCQQAVAGASEHCWMCDVSVMVPMQGCPEPSPGLICHQWFNRHYLMQHLKLTGLCHGIAVLSVSLLLNLLPHLCPLSGTVSGAQ